MSDRFGDYAILRKVAIGGMAEIFQAQDQLGNMVAIKKILPELATEQKFVQMFLDEVRIVIQLNHPNIVQLLDFGLVDASYYFSMEWVEGKSLADVIVGVRRAGLWMPADVMLEMGIQVCDALYYAHSKKDRYERPLNIIHRDLSPPNIMVNDHGVFKVADFGIAQVRDKNVRTQPGIIRGKFSYMSPEQSMGKALDARSDLFAIGIVMYESLTNSRLFLRKNESETLDAVRRCHVPPLREFRKDIPNKLEQLLRKTLSQNASHRPSSAGELAESLRKLKAEYFSQSSPDTVREFLATIFPGEMFESDSAPKRKSRAFTTQRGMSLTEEDHIPVPLQVLNRYRFYVSGGLALLTCLLVHAILV